MMLEKYPEASNEYHYFLKSLGQLDALKTDHSKPTIDQLLYDYLYALSGKLSDATIDSLGSLYKRYHVYPSLHDYTNLIRVHSEILKLQLTQKKTNQMMSNSQSLQLLNLEDEKSLMTVMYRLTLDYLQRNPTIPYDYKKIFYLNDMQFEYIIVKACAELKIFDRLKKFYSNTLSTGLFKTKIPNSATSFENICYILKEKDAPEEVIYDYIRFMPDKNLQLYTAENLNILVRKSSFKMEYSLEEFESLQKIAFLDIQSTYDITKKIVISIMAFSNININEDDIVVVHQMKEEADQIYYATVQARNFEVEDKFPRIAKIIFEENFIKGVENDNGVYYQFSYLSTEEEILGTSLPFLFRKEKYKKTDFFKVFNQIGGCQLEDEATKSNYIYCCNNKIEELKKLFEYYHSSVVKGLKKEHHIHFIELIHMPFNDATKIIDSMTVKKSYKKNEKFTLLNEEISELKTMIMKFIDNRSSILTGTGETLQDINVQCRKNSDLTKEIKNMILENSHNLMLLSERIAIHENNFAQSRKIEKDSELSTYCIEINPTRALPSHSYRENQVGF
ncbi:hypothetical protein HZS_6645 [Henneguya salminicola]|nr:hypothetical protein HZS_6645 [Henneguya salminicola]